MDQIGALSEGEWTSLSGMYTAEEADDFMAQLLENCPPSSMAVPDAFWTGNEDQSAMNISAGNYEGSHYSSESTNADLYRISSQGSDCSGGGNRIFCPTSSNESYYLSDSHPMLVTNNSNGSMSFDFRTRDAKNINSYLIEGDDHQCLNQETSGGNVEESGGNQPEAVTLEKKRFEMTVQGPASMEQKSMPPKNSMKRAQSFGDVQINKRNTRSKKSLQVTTRNNEEDGNVGLNRQSSSSCCSVDDSIASQELSGGVTSTSSLSPKEAAALNLDGKSRARRGSATVPQSLYARKRREKINERLRVLQNLVPNGTKVDISTMLEEAVHYVKFLQLQIKLLSSDDVWMYAPICYNGMDLGLGLKLFTPPKPS